MNASFNILTPRANTSDCNLMVEVSERGLSFVVIDEDMACIGLSLYQFPQGTTADQASSYLKDIVARQTLLQQTFRKTTFVYSFSVAVMVPDEFMDTTATTQLLDMVYGDTSGCIIRNDFINRQNLHTIFGVPKQINTVIENLFTGFNHTHLYSLLPGIVKEGGNQLYCIFNPNNITVLLVKAGVVQVTQNIFYKTSEDVAYNLLNICERFDAPVADVQVTLNGMIDQKSSLYTEVYKYFEHLNFGTQPTVFYYNDEIAKFPAHYFSHLFHLAACV